MLNPEYITHPENAFHALAENLASDNSTLVSSRTELSEPEKVST